MSKLKKVGKFAFNTIKNNDIMNNPGYSIFILKMKNIQSFIGGVGSLFIFYCIFDITYRQGISMMTRASP